MFLFGIYTNITLTVTAGIPWVAVPASIAGILMLAKNYSSIQLRHLTPMLMLLIISALSIVFAPDMYGLFSERAKSLLHLTHSLVICYGFYLELVSWRREQVLKITFIAVILIVVGTALENYAGLDVVSDAFRQMVYSKFVYDADIRDLTVFGIVRPKLFTLEPSYVARFFLLIISIWLLLSRHPLRFIIFFVLLMAGVFLIRSPVLIVGSFVALLVIVLPKPLAPGQPRPNMAKKFIILLVIGVLTITILYLVVSIFFSARLDLIIAGRDPSFVIRMTGPMMIAWETIMRYPLFGVGIGGQGAILDIFINVYMPFFKVEWIYEFLEFAITNVFWLYWVFYGLLGGVLGAIAIKSLIHRLGSGPIFFPLMIILIYTQTTGAYVTPGLWAAVFFVLAATVLNTRHESDE